MCVCVCVEIAFRRSDGSSSNREGLREDQGEPADHGRLSELPDRPDEVHHQAAAVPAGIQDTTGFLHARIQN